MILATKIALPTVDVVTDALGINKVLSLPAHNRNYTNLYYVAYAMIGIMVLSWLMTLPHFCRIEKSLWQKIKALPFLICCSWPQYRATRLIWLAYWAKNEEQFKREQTEFEDTLSHIGKLTVIDWLGR